MPDTVRLRPEPSAELLEAIERLADLAEEYAEEAIRERPGKLRIRRPSGLRLTLEWPAEKDGAA